MLDSKQRSALKMAERIHEQLSQGHSAQTQKLQLPEDNWDECQRLFRRMEIARSRGWNLAVRKLLPQLPLALRALQLRLEQLTPTIQLKAVPSLRAIYEEVLALEAEFPRVTCDLRKGTLAVETESLVLEGVALGSFEIRLEVKNRPNGFTYEVLALEPYPSASNSSVTHPHVQDGQLCEGEGRAAIRSALDSGRLCDFFVIVSQILRTYNPSSAYVELDNWSGEPCEDCGGITDDEDRWNCEGCERLLCSECYVSCSDCGDAHCSDCTNSCEGCDESLCRKCQHSCESCGNIVCHSCLEEDDVCKSCHAASAVESTSHAHETTQEPPLETVPAEIPSP